MKYFILPFIATMLWTTSFAQTYTTNSVSEYDQVYGKKFTFVKTTLHVECTWEVSDKMFYRDCFNNGAYWTVADVIKLPNGKKYVMDAHGLDNTWVIVDGSGFIQLFEDNGQTLRKFKIIKKEKDTPHL